MSNTLRRWVVSYEMYDLRGTLLSRRSDNDVMAENGIIASRMVRTDFDNNRLWPHIKIKVTGAKLYGNAAGAVAPIKTGGLKQYIITYKVDRASGTKEESIKFNARNKAAAEQHIRDHFARAANKANVHSIKVVEYGKE